MISGSYSVTPDGSEALFYNSFITGEAEPSNGDAYRPLTERINLTAGQMVSTTNITHTITTLPPTYQEYDHIDQVLWIPGTHKALVTFRDINPLANNALIDLDTDFVTWVKLPDYPLAWSPDGKTLILCGSSSNSDGANNGPCALTAVTFTAGWQVASSVTLTRNAGPLPILGFVHNP
jgi:hypothetical protein